MNRISDDQMLVALGQAKDRIYAAREGQGDLVTELHAYRELLARCDVSVHRLVQAKEELSDRLAGGWAKTEADPRLENYWLTLLVRYEAVEDALDLPATRRRLSAWEAVHYLKNPAGPPAATLVARQ